MTTEERFKQYARQLLDLRLKDAEIRGISADDARDLSVLIADAFSRDVAGDDKTTDTPQPTTHFRLKRKRRARKGSVVEWSIKQLEERWNGGVDEFTFRIPANMCVSSVRNAISRFLNGRIETTPKLRYTRGLLEGSNLEACVTTSGDELHVLINERDVTE